MPMKECFDYQASLRIDMIFHTYLKEIIIFYLLFLFNIIFFREN